MSIYSSLDKAKHFQPLPDTRTLNMYNTNTIRSSPIVDICQLDDI